MIDLEEATQHQHARAVRESEPHGAEIDAAAPPFAVARREAVGVSVPTP